MVPVTKRKDTTTERYHARTLGNDNAAERSISLPAAPTTIMMSSSPGEPRSTSEKNPLLAAYDKFQSETPAFTRITVFLLVSSWFLSFFLSPLVLDCTWLFISRRFEIYRIFTSVLVNTDLFSNILAGFLLVQFGQRLEVTVGSACMVWWSSVVFTLVTNGIFTLLQSILVELSIVPSAAVWTSAGLWNIVLGLLAIEACRSAPSQPVRTFCSFWKIPTLYHPLAYLVLVGMFGKAPVALAISTACGYTVGQQRSMLPMPQGFKLAVDRYGRGMKGWIENSSGDVLAPVGGETEMLLSSERGESSTTIPSSSGQTLGGASHRNVDARAARLQALERNA